MLTKKGDRHQHRCNRFCILFDLLFRAFSLHNLMKFEDELKRVKYLAELVNMKLSMMVALSISMSLN